MASCRGVAATIVWDGTAESIEGTEGGDVIVGTSGKDVINGNGDKRWGHEPDAWLPLLEEYFGDIGETANALMVLGCESNGEPFIRRPQTPHGRAMGLFQFIPGTWKRWSPETPGWAGESPFHPEANTATARRLYDAYVDWDNRWGWTPWSCNRLLDGPRW